jgi:hypothetical protein
LGLKPPYVVQAAGPTVFCHTFVVHQQHQLIDPQLLALLAK